MTTVWSSDDQYNYPDDVNWEFDEDDYGCLDPDSCGDPCMGECYATSY